VRYEQQQSGDGDAAMPHGDAIQPAEPALAEWHQRGEHERVGQQWDGLRPEELAGELASGLTGRARDQP
jgi:hypothetical protein